MIDVTAIGFMRTDLPRTATLLGDDRLSLDASNPRAVVLVWHAPDGDDETLQIAAEQAVAMRVPRKTLEERIAALEARVDAVERVRP